jgi:2-keto-4-pentenoate hydratase/2-oxohepta-3-ene-1,7-dioic acid hydratase in catechol pathway
LVPIGPYILTKDELPDYQNLDMFLNVDGKRMQTGNTEQMIFDIKTLVSYMSSCMSLHPGDICCTGTPPGVGENMSPPYFLKGGEEVILGIDKLGEQKHSVIPFKD